MYRSFFIILTYFPCVVYANFYYTGSAANHTVGLKSNGSVINVGDDKGALNHISAWGDRFVAIDGGYECAVGLESDGTVIMVDSFFQGEDIRYNKSVLNVTENTAIAAGYEHIVVLRSDGTVVTKGDNEHGQCDVDSWKNIVAISAGTHHTVGLKADGTVVAVGDNEYGQCDVEDWNLFE